MSNIKMRRGQLWDCGSWGVACITTMDRPSKVLACVHLKVVFGGLYTRKGDVIVLQRSSFESGDVLVRNLIRAGIVVPVSHHTCERGLTPLYISGYDGRWA